MLHKQHALLFLVCLNFRTPDCSAWMVFRGSTRNAYNYNEAKIECGKVQENLGSFQDFGDEESIRDWLLSYPGKYRA